MHVSRIRILRRTIATVLRRNYGKPHGGMVQSSFGISLRLESADGSARIILGKAELFCKAFPVTIGSGQMSRIQGGIRSPDAVLTSFYYPSEERALFRVPVTVGIGDDMHDPRILREIIGLLGVPM